MDELNIVLDENSISNMIYEIRGQKVMLDFELAKIYGYDTRDLNNQIKRNSERFDDDFYFQLNKVEFDSILKWRKSTSSWGGRRKLPFAFTEQGIYMLMTVLKGELAVRQSKALVRLFKSMKDYIVTSNNLLNVNELLKLSNQVNENTNSIKQIENKLEIVMDNFIDPSTYKHFLMLDGEKIEADVAFQTIYSLAKQSLIIIDDYINLKTLNNLKTCDKNITITICSDNVSRNKLTSTELNDYISDTGMNIVLKPTNNRVHDRYIVIDYNTDNERIYHSGSSSKDSGNKMTTIMKIEYTEGYHRIIDELIK